MMWVRSLSDRLSSVSTISVSSACYFISSTRFTSTCAPSVVKSERVAKYVARCGFASRREAEKFIEEGRVHVNGLLISRCGDRIEPGSIVTLDGSALIQPLRRARIFLYHKPCSEIVSTVSPRKDLPTVFETIAKSRDNKHLHLPRLIAVGRLDVASEGLLILSSSPSLASLLEHPKNKFSRIYLARVFGEIDHEKLAELAKGVTIDGVSYGRIYVTVRRERRRNSWLEIRLDEGKNREVRKVLQWAGMAVNRLIRTRFGPFRLDNLPVGSLREIPLPKDLSRKIT